MDFNITLIPGDGIGPEIVAEAVKVLNKTGEIYHASFHFTKIPKKFIINKDNNKRKV